MMPTLTQQYLDMGQSFSRKTLPSAATNPQLLLWNDELAKTLNIDADSDTLAGWFSGTQLMPGSEPIAMAYAGHQFGQFNPQLGDGRAHLLGELTTADNQVFDLHLKGSGPTPFSRGGDGYCALGPAVREFMMSEAMHALGVPTTRSLSVVLTGSEVIRQVPQPGAVVSRVASSHIRFGTFEYFAARRQFDALKTLFDRACSVHHPEIDLENPNRHIQFLTAVMHKQIELVTHWLRVGFIHGVMNTDNCLVSGETIDYGPCAMLGVYDPDTVFSSIDRHGRYAFGQQAHIMHWNLARLAESILPLIDEDLDTAIAAVMPMIEAYPEQFDQSFDAMMMNKLGLPSTNPDLSNACLHLMQSKQLDYTLTFVKLHESLNDETAEQWCQDKFGQWYDDWRQQITPESLSLMQQHNPLVIPRNHVMEKIIKDVEKTLEVDEIKRLLSALKSLYAATEGIEAFQATDPQSDLNHQTFCGT